MLRLVLLLAAVAASAGVGAGLVSSGAGPGAGGPGSSAGGRGVAAMVVSITDGDTLRARLADGRRERVRVIGIDTPELRPRDGGSPECFARAATERLSKLVLRRGVRLEPDREARDRFGRSLFYVRRAADDVDVGAVLLREGFAQTLEVRPNTARAGRYAGLEREARRARRGRWAACGG